LTLICEATEDQHCLPPDGVNNVANLLVVEQEIDELRDLDIVDRDLRLVPFCDDQVLLFGPLHFWTPRGCAIDATAGEVSARKVRLRQSGILEVRPVEVCPGEVRLGEVRLAEVRHGEVRPAEVRPAKVRPAEVRLAEVWTDVGVLMTPRVPGVHA